MSRARARSPEPPAPISGGEFIIRFVERLLVHTKGVWAGRPFLMTPNQKGVTRRIFDPVDETGARVVRKALLGYPRKNGKSTYAAAIAIAMMAADGEQGAEVYSAAGDKDQARAVFAEAKRMVERSLIASECRCYRDVIEHTPTESIYRCLSADAPTKHGLNPHLVVYDELHVAQKRDLWDTLTTAQGTRRQPLILAATTAGFDRASILWELYQYGCMVRDGAVVDPTFVFEWLGADVGDDWRSEAVWRKANPGIDAGYLSLRFLQDEARQAEAMPARQNAFRQLYLNQWVEQSSRWIDLVLWDANGVDAAGDVIAGDAWDGAEVWGGLDLGSVDDLTSLVWVRRSVAGGVGVRHRSFVPEAMLDRANPKAKNWSLYRAFVDAGVLEVTPGPSVDYATIRARVLLDAERFNVRRLALDALFQGMQLGQELAAEGLPVFGMRQGFLSMGPAVLAFERRLLGREVHHGADPVLRWCAQNVVVRRDPAGNQKIDKERSQEKVDPLVALVMALDGLEREGGEDRSVYDDADKRPEGFLAF